MAHSNLNQVDISEEGNFSFNVADLEEKIGAGKNFEETLEILGKEISIFEVVTTTTAGALNPSGLLNTRPINPIPLPNSKSPLTNITNLSPTQEKPTPKASPKWTRIKRQVGITDETVALNAALGKRIAHLPHSDSTPSKYRILNASSLKENLISVAEASTQPRLEQQVVYVGMCGGFRTIVRFESLQSWCEHKIPLSCS